MEQAKQKQGQINLQGNMQGNQSTNLNQQEFQAQQAQKQQNVTVNPLYQRVNENEADAMAWVFAGPDKLEKYFYRFPPLALKDVRVRVLYSGIGKLDVEKGRGQIEGVRYPFCGGEEIVGEVVAIGKEVTSVKISDKVLVGMVRDSCKNCDMCKIGETSLCYKLPEEERQNINGKYFGGFSTHVQQPESHIFKLPDDINPEFAAPLMSAGIAVYRPLMKYGKKGFNVGMIGVGNLGHLAIKFARAMGMNVDAFINKTDMDKYHDILNLGVGKINEWDEDHCMKLAQNTYDMLLYMLPVALSADEMNKLMLTLKPMGRFILIGLPPQDQMFEVSFMPVVLRDIQIIGTFGGGHNDTQSMLNFVKSNKIEAECEFFEFDDFPKAIERVEKGHPRFAVVLRVDQVSRRFKQ